MRDFVLPISLVLTFVNNNKQKQKQNSNDIVVIVYNDCVDTPFDPSLLTSKFNHVFVIVQGDSRCARARSCQENDVNGDNNVTFFGL